MTRLISAIPFLVFPTVSTVGQATSHNVILRVVRVTTDWMPYTSTNGWASAVKLRESDALKFYEVAIWEEISAVHLYAFPNEYNPLYGLGDVSAEQKIAYREQFRIKEYTGLPEIGYSSERSIFLKSAFKDIASFLSSEHPDSDHHLMYSGHGGPGGDLFAATMLSDDAAAFLDHWTKSIAKPLGVIDMGGPCNKGSFSDLDNFCQYTQYYVASDLPNGGYTMDEWDIDKWYQVLPELQYHTLFATNENLVDVLKGRIDLKRTRYEYSINNMIENKVEQANYLYSCEMFKKFREGFLSFLDAGRGAYSVFDDLHQYMIKNRATDSLISAFSDVFVHKADNRDFFEWEVVSGGMLMPDPEKLIHFESLVATLSLTVGAPLAPIQLPKAIGGRAPMTYSLVPSPPVGLSFDATARTLSGIPTTPMDFSTYTYTAVDSDSRLINLDFEISVAGAVQFQSTVADYSLPRASSISPIELPAATGGTAPVTYTLSPTLPFDLSFADSARIISGIPFSVTDNTQYTYSATDANGSADTLRFNLMVYSPVNTQTETLPTTFALKSNYPNPFGRSTRITFDLSSESKISVDVLDVAGRLMQRIPTQTIAAGWDRSVEFSGASLSSGVYVYRLQIDSTEGLTTHTGRFIVIR